MVQRKENTKKEQSLLFQRLQHSGVNGGFDFETKNVKGHPLVVAWGISFHAKNFENKKNPVFPNEIIAQLIAEKEITVKKVTKWYRNGDKGKFKYKGYVITGVNMQVFLYLLDNCLKNIRLAGQYNSSFDNPFIYEIGKKFDFFNHIEYTGEKEIIDPTKAEYLKYLQKHHNPKAKGKMEVLKVHGKYYRMVWQNKNNKKIIFDDDWLISGYGLPVKGEIIGLKKQEHDDFRNIPVFGDAVQLAKSTKWHNYLIYDVIIVHIYSEITLKTWADKNGGYNNIKLTKSSNAFFYHKKTFTETIADEMVKEKVISKPYWKKAKPNNPASTKKIKVCDILNHQILKEKYHLESKKPYLKYNQMLKDIWKDYFAIDWLKDNEFYVANDLQDFKIGGLVHLNDTVFKDGNSYLVCKHPKKAKVKIAKLDINSSYPAVMCSETLLCPFGAPIKCNRLDLSKYQLIRLTPKYDIHKEPSFMPVFKITKDGKNKWIHSLIKKKEYYLDTNMWQYFKEHYNIRNFKIEYCYTFQAKSMAYFFKKTIQTEYANKSKWKGVNEALYLQAKIILNSIFGKFVTKWLKKESFFNDDKQKRVTYKNYIKGEYMPIGIAILNAARIKLCETVNDKYRFFKYCDTDSLCLLIPSDVSDYKKYFHDKWNLELDDTKIGEWDLEGVYSYWGFFQPKAYLVANRYIKATNEGGECIRKRAGYTFAEYNKDDKSLPMINSYKWKRYCTAKNIRSMLDMYINGCLVPMQTERQYDPGHGVMLNDVTKEIKPIYDEYYHMTKEEYLAKHVI